MTPSSLRNLPFQSCSSQGKSQTTWTALTTFRLSDLARNECYDAAIRKIISKFPTPPVVLNISHCSGLMSMMAARAGAKQVTACELGSSYAQVTQQVLTMNGHEGKIRLICKEPSKLEAISWTLTMSQLTASDWKGIT